VLPRTNWQLPKNAAFWLVTVIFGVLLFSTLPSQKNIVFFRSHLSQGLP
jgi:hypothetical protein